MKNIEKYIMVILIFVAVGAIGAAVYFGINADKDKTIEENKQQESLGTDKEEKKEEGKSEATEKEMLSQATKDKIFQIYNDFNKETWKVAYQDNKFMLNIFDGKNQSINYEYKLYIALANAQRYDIANSEIEKNYKIWLNEHNMDGLCSDGGYIKLSDVRNLLKEYFGDDYLSEKIPGEIGKNITEVGLYFYDDKAKVFYFEGCGGYVGPETIILGETFEEQENAYYIYQSVAYVNFLKEDANGVSTFGVYADYDDYVKINDNYLETVTSNDYQVRYEINDTNRHKFHRYAYKFVEGENNNWYLESVEMVK